MPPGSSRQWLLHATAPSLPAPDCNGTTLAQYLQYLQEQAQARQVYIHPAPLTFPHGANRENWRDAFAAADNLAGREVFINFLRARKDDGSTVWLACFSTVMANWVKQKDWPDIPLHCWAVALIRRTDGQPRRALLIYDVDPIQVDPSQVADPRTLERTRTWLTGPQNQFVDLCRKERVVDDIIW